MLLIQLMAAISAATPGAYTKVLVFSQQVLHEYVRAHAEVQGVDARVPVRPHPLKVGLAEMEQTTLCALR